MKTIASPHERRRLRPLLFTHAIVAASLGALAAFAIVAAPAPARAQAAAPVTMDKSFDIDLFQPAIGPRNFLTVDSPEVPIHKQVTAGLYFDYQRRPYRLVSNGGGGTLVIPVDSQLRSDVQVAFGLFDRVQIGLSLPITLALSGDNVDLMSATPTGTYSTRGIGDLRIEAKGQVLTRGDDDQFVLAALLGGTVPTGDKNNYLGDKTATGRVKALASYQLGRVRFGGQLGVMLRGTSTSIDAKQGSALIYGGAVGAELYKSLEGMVEVAGRSGLDDFGKRWWDENPFEADLALRYYPMSMVGVTGGAGAGLGKGIGAPQFRAFLGAVFAPDFRDADHDGVYDADDKCPDQPEDKDGYKDNDGCPDPDNDGDGILDVNDKCPNDPEDFDQFEDADGCPDLDNDKDGIPDINDPCPNAPEDGKGKRPNDGCPSTSEDSDGDGVPDAMDKCPDEPEDKDGFQDEDGCPDPDNDGDGIPDGFDSCPNEAEDVDGFEDEDGCPDPDNDKDGIPDAQDKCPNEPETLNGIKDDDGCPDAGRALVKLTEGRIELATDKLAFSGHGSHAELKDTSVMIVGLVGMVMKGHPELKKVRIDVHGDTLSKDETQRRAEMVRDVLIKRGVDGARLVANGAGPGGNKVEFIIVETAKPQKGGAAPAAPAAPDSGGGGTE